jgi:uncharacterized Fe-S cluster-containing radical SAM superfamily protein
MAGAAAHNSPTAIDTDRFSRALRSRGISLADLTVRISTLTASEQEQDLSEPANCGGLGRVRHFRRATAPGWPENPLPIDPASRALNRPATPQLRAQVFQNAVCNWRCWYCYVDFELLSGRSDRSQMVSADQLVDLWRSSPDPADVLDLSGGQPDLVPEWVAWTLRAVQERGLENDTYVWSDDNLSNDYFFSCLTRQDRQLLDEYRNYGKVCCFKGFDPQSFAFNTAAAPELFDRQFALMRRLVQETNIDLYAYATFTSPVDDGLGDAMKRFVDRVQDIDEYLPLRLVPLRIETFTPTKGRTTPETARAAEVQDDAAQAWTEELAERFSAADLTLPAHEVPLRGRRR